MEYILNAGEGKAKSLYSFFQVANVRSMIQDAFGEVLLFIII